MNYLQLPKHVLKARLSGAELLIYADVWTMQKGGREYWKSNQTIATAFGVEKRSVVRAIARLESRGFLLRQSNDKGRYLEALVPEAKDDPTVMGDVTVMGDRNGKQGDPTVMGGMTEMAQRDDRTVTQIENNRKENREENRESASLVFPWSSESFEMAWNEWREYKRIQFRFKYKTTKSEQLALHKLHNETNGDEQRAIEAIATAIASGWRGLFPRTATSNQGGGRNLNW